MIDECKHFASLKKKTTHFVSSILWTIALVSFGCYLHLNDVATGRRENPSSKIRESPQEKNKKKMLQRYSY